MADYENMTMTQLEGEITKRFPGLSDASERTYLCWLIEDAIPRLEWKMGGPLQWGRGPSGSVYSVGGDGTYGPKIQFQDDASLDRQLAVMILLNAGGLREKPKSEPAAVECSAAKLLPDPIMARNVFRRMMCVHRPLDADAATGAVDRIEKLEADEAKARTDAKV